MGKEITLTTTLLIAMDSTGTRVTRQLPYDNNMLYLPFPDTSMYIADSDSIGRDKIVIATLETKKPHRTSEEIGK